VLADASWTVLSAPVSDRTVKQNISPITYGLATILKLKPVSFEFKEGWKNYGQGTQIGFIAQDIQKVLPNSVFMNTSGKAKGKLGYSWQDIIPITVSALQELVIRVNEQQKTIDYLTKKVNKLEHK
jgi:hypothetical protein